MPPVDTLKQIALVLIVDDDHAARERLCAIFEKAGYRPLVASDLTSTLRIMQTEECDLVVVNLDKLGADGLSVCKVLRARPATNRIPIIAISNVGDETVKSSAFAAGADDYISHPSSPAEIVSRS